MEKNINILINKFHEINQKEWIKGVNQTFSSVGLTFENELGKKVDSELFPDYEGIELKCSQRYSKYPVGLFNKAFDGPSFFETNEITQKYGTLYKNDSNRKYLFVNLICNEKVLVNDKYYFELSISYEEEKMYMKIYDLNNHLLDAPYIEFASINDRLRIKLNNLALIYASKKDVNDEKYFRYYELLIYKLKSEKTFYYLIEKNVVKLSLICRADVNNTDKQKNKGINFRIFKDNLEWLFDKIVDYDADLKQITFNSNDYFS